ncbi:hypothetical protein CXB51_009550 [Gossypium anomalum]|uniref:DUF7745 domain-containing protein n=1 Tax=Gossypium anomalum TaxID=47600 RepID=A0A8J5ZC77_9ROSI|nr:hypothetical protein CXB51_009550 [Gossypium anomalum]
MENGLLDRVEGNVNVHRWSEQTQAEKGDSIVAGYVSELSEYTRISVTQNNLQELTEIWDQWGNETKQLFYSNYGDLPYLLNVQIDEYLFRGLTQFWNPAYSYFTFGEVDLVPTVEEYTALLRCPRTLGYVDEATTDLFHRLSKRVTPVPAILAETFRSLGSCRRTGAGRFVSCAQLLLAWFYSHFRLIDRVVCRVFFEDYSPLKDIIASTRRVDVPEENWIPLLQNLQSKDVEWRAPWMIPGEILYRCGSFDWVPLLGICGAIGYTPLLVLRQFGLRQFVPETHGLTQSEFAYRGADYKKRVREISSTWNKTCRLKGVAISPVTTSEYVEWRGRRVNDNIPKPNAEETRPMEEYLQMVPSELEIMKQEFERKNLELEKRITKLEEEKMYLNLDIDVQKMEVEKERKKKRKIEEDRDDLKEYYKKAQISLRRAKIGGSSDQLQKEVQKEKLELSIGKRSFRRCNRETLELERKVKDLEVALQESKLRIKQLEMQEDYLKGELYQSRGQINERDHVMGEAIAQIREVAKYVQDLAVRADVLSMMYGSSSDIGKELALLLDRVKTLGIRAKAYL